MTIRLNIADEIAEYEFQQENIRIGKHTGNDICTGGYSTRVSRYHAVLSWDGAKWVIRDEKSMSGTYVNGRRVENGAALDLRSGDRIRIGDIELEVCY
jgi:ABC transport system ATP-binding/permease protein